MLIVLSKTEGSKRTFKVVHNGKTFIVSAYGLIVTEIKCAGEIVVDQVIEDFVSEYLKKHYSPQI